MEVTKDAQKLLTNEAGQVFGEAALLYNCSYTYSLSGSQTCSCRLHGLVLCGRSTVQQ